MDPPSNPGSGGVVGGVVDAGGGIVVAATGAVVNAAVVAEAMVVGGSVGVGTGRLAAVVGAADASETSDVVVLARSLDGAGSAVASTVSTWSPSSSPLVTTAMTTSTIRRSMMIHAQTGTPAIRRRRNERFGSVMIDGGGVTGPGSLGAGNSGGGEK